MASSSNISRFRNWFKNQTKLAKVIISGIFLFVLICSLPFLPYIIGLLIILFPIVSGLFIIYKLIKSNSFHKKSVRFTAIALILSLSIFAQTAWSSHFFSTDPADNQNTPTQQQTPTEEPVPTIEETKQESQNLYNVTKVVDGDTLVVNIEGVTETLRLIGIDTPETQDPRKPVQCFGQEATNKANELLNGKKVRLEADETQNERDIYDRLLRYIYLEDGTFINEIMIKEGYAFEYTYDVPYKYQQQFKDSQDYAQSNKQGLWADNTCAGSVEPTPTNTPMPSQKVYPINAPVATPTSTPPTSTPKPQTNNAICDCSANIYNCGDFSTHNEAQACFEYCGGINNDVHKLDGNDNDGLACESLP